MHKAFECAAIISTTSIASNVRRFQSALGERCKIMAVVKANGYGHGIIQAAQAAVQGGAAWLGVVRMDEALELRRAGVTTPILQLSYTPSELMAQAATRRVCVTLFDKEQLAHAAQVAERLGLAIEVHVKVDTGMGRIGVQPEETGAFFAELLRYRPHVRATGVFTHLARADEDTDFNAEQLDRFAAALRGIEALGAGLPHWIHIANSAATIRLPERIKTLSTMVRMGLNTYGLRYAPSVPLPTDVEPALRWVSQLCHIKRVAAGRGLGYGHSFVTPKDMRIGTCPVGYADGLKRTASHQVLVRGKRVNVVGRVCMDSILVDLDAVPEARVGDEVVLVGSQGAAQILVSDVAARCGTIDCDVTCGITARVPRIYTLERFGCEKIVTSTL